MSALSYGSRSLQARSSGVEVRCGSLAELAVWAECVALFHFFDLRDGRRYCEMLASYTHHDSVAIPLHQFAAAGDTGPRELGPKVGKKRLPAVSTRQTSLPRPSSSASSWPATAAASLARLAHPHLRGQRRQRRHWRAGRRLDLGVLGGAGPTNARWAAQLKSARSELALASGLAADRTRLRGAAVHALSNHPFSSVMPAAAT
jgi:hypothetical protein